MRAPLVSGCLGFIRCRVGNIGFGVEAVGSIIMVRKRIAGTRA